MRAAADLPVGEVGEEALDQAYPGRRGWRVVGAPTRPLGEPISDGLGLVGGYIVHDDADVEITGNVGFDDVQEGAELARPMAGKHLPMTAGGGVERREQAEGSVTRVVMGAQLDLAWAHGQKGVRSIERLNLALFIDAEDNGAFGRRQVKADDVAHFFRRTADRSTT